MMQEDIVKKTRPVIVFDLDDTLVDTSHVYWVARSDFVNVMADCGLDPSVVINKFEEIDGDNMNSMGFSPGRYGKSMKDTYQWLVQNSNLVASTRIETLVNHAGNLIFSRMPELIDGAQELLEWCYTRFDLILLTRGFPELQMKKIEVSNIGHYFSSIKIVSDKKVSDFREFILETGHSLRNAWVLGDSIKSDINPGIELGLKCILFVYTHHSYYWQQEYGKKPSGRFYLITGLRDAINVLQHPEKSRMVETIDDA